MTEFQERKNIINELPQEDRVRLERNLETYQAMRPAEQARYWEMHEYVARNQLEPLVDDYCEWLETLTPFQAQQLRQSPEPAAQIAITESILKENQNEDDEQLLELMARMLHQDGRGATRMFAGRFGPDSRTGRFATDPFVLSQSQLDRVVNGILLRELNANSRDQINQMNQSSFERMSRIIAGSLAVTNDPRTNWPSQQILMQIEQEGIDLLSDKEIPEQDRPRFLQMLQSNPQRYLLRKRLAFRMLLLRSLLVAQMREFAARDQVTNNELHMFFTQLESSTQATLLNSPADYQAEALKWLYLWQEHKDESLFERPEFVENVLMKMMPPGPGFSGRWKEEGNRDRRPDRRRTEPPPRE